MIGFFSAGAMIHSGSPPGSLTVESVAQTSHGTADSTHAVDYPISVSAGNLLIAAITVRAGSLDPQISTPPGWTLLFRNGSGTTVNAATQFYLFYRLANGSESGSFSVAINMNCELAAQVWRISGQGAASPVYAQAGANATTDPDPPSLSSGFTGDILWICGYGSNGAASPVTWPTGFDDNQTTTPSGGGSSMPCRVIAASMISSSSTVNPSAFTMSANTNYRAFTLAISP